MAKSKSQLILGIDPGYDRCGFGLVQGSGMDWKHIAHGVITTSAKNDFSIRLLEIGNDLRGLIAKFKPQILVVEELFFSKSTTTALGVAEARGVIRYIGASAGLQIIEVKPNEVKLAVAGYGRADKKQMQTMIKTTLKLAKIPRPDDAADALAIALTGAQKARYED